MKKNSLIFGLIVFLCSILLGTAGITAQAAEEEDDDGGAFVIEAQVQPSDDPVFQIQLTVANLGGDWEGIVRLRLDNGYVASGGCVYDTVLSLPQGSTKQFAVKMPKDGIDRTDGIVAVTLLDQKSRTVAKKDFPKLLQNRADGLSMGILSDEYASLTYLDMGGNEIYFVDRNRPIKLVQLNQDSLTQTLDTLTYLVIDSYDTKSLTDEEEASIERWVDSGGILIVGTGTNAEKTLGGLDFLGIQYRETKEINRDLYTWDYYMDVSQLSWVELEDAGDVFDGRYATGISLSGSWGNGSVNVLPCALTELGKLGADAYDRSDEEENTYYETTQESLVETILNNASDYADLSYRSGDVYYETDYNMQRIFPSLGKGSNRLQFGGLKLLVVLYVVFVGPVLYLILRAMKKRDLYWIAVPAATLVGIFLVYWAGRGFEVSSTNVYSVTVENLSENKNAITYLRCYDAGHKEWSLQMAEGYTYAGALSNRYYYSYDDGNESDYYHRIQKEGDRLFVGLNPEVGFEDGYFMAGTPKTTASGTISWDGNKTVTNETEWDFSYFAVITDNDMLIYRDLPAGQSVRLDENKCEYRDSVSTSNYYTGSSSYTPAETYFYGYLRDSLRAEEKEDIDVKAALGMGISKACFNMGSDKVIIVGVVEDWNKTVDDNCSETSYGCLYTVMEE